MKQDIEVNSEVEPDAYRWVVTYNNMDIIGGGIFTDMKMASDYAGTSEKTFYRRLMEEGNIFKVNGFNVMRLPYYKSKRGR